MRGGPTFTMGTGRLGRRVGRCLNVDAIATIHRLVHCSIRGVSSRMFRGTYGAMFTRPPMSSLCLRGFSITRNTHMFSMRFLPKRFSRETSSTIRYMRFLSRGTTPVVHSTAACMVRKAIASTRFRTVGRRYVGPISSHRANLRGPRALMAMFPSPRSIGVFSKFGSVTRTSLGRLCSSLGLTVAFGSFRRVRGCFEGRRGHSPSVARVHILSAC